MHLDGTEFDKEVCENMKAAASKYGMTVVCNEEDEKGLADITLPADENCEHMREVALKSGKVIVCDENA